MTRRGDDSETGRTTEIHLPCRLSGEGEPITLAFTQCSPARKRLLDLEVVVPGRVGGHNTHTFRMFTHEPACGRLADELQRLYDTRDVTISPGLQDDANVESYIAFGAHNLEAEEISFVGMFRYDFDLHNLPEDPLDKKLSDFSWYQEQKQVLHEYAWVIGFHGFLISRSELPEIIAKLRTIARWGRQKRR